MIDAQVPVGIPRPLPLVGILTALLLGGVLRLSFPDDIEYKEDERLFFVQARDPDLHRAFPASAFPTSTGLRAPGMSAWGFSAAARILNIETPPGLAGFVQWLNTLALCAMAVALVWIVKADEREVWLWGIALGAVNPLSIVWQRKIWNPSLLPMLVVLFLIGWRFRDRRLGAFVWGLVGGILGQIHMGGFFFAGGYLVWTWCRGERPIRWTSFLLGSALAAVPMIFWLRDVIQTAGVSNGRSVAWQHLLEGRFWTLWLRAPTGLGLDAFLGASFQDFLEYPYWHGRPTWGMLAVYLGLLGLGLWTVALRVRETRNQGMDWRRYLALDKSFTGEAVGGALWGYGLLLTATLLTVHRHYLIILFPLEFVWLARIVLGSETRGNSLRAGRVILFVACVLQAALSAGFLNYVHQFPEIAGEYGRPYRVQTARVDGHSGRY